MSGACSTPSSAEKQLESSNPSAFGYTDSNHPDNDFDNMDRGVTSQIIHVSGQTFESEVLQSRIPVVVDFYATWCSPCRALGPILDRLAVEFGGQIKFVKVNSDEEPELANRYDVTALPTLVFVEDGNNIGQTSGVPQEDELRGELNQWIEVPEIQSQ